MSDIRRNRPYWKRIAGESIHERDAALAENAKLKAALQEVIGDFEAFIGDDGDWDDIEEYFNDYNKKVDVAMVAIAKAKEALDAS